MIKHVINDLEKLQMCSSVIEKQAESLTEGVKSKIYKPLLTRMKCGNYTHIILLILSSTQSLKQTPSLIITSSLLQKL